MLQPVMAIKVVEEAFKETKGSYDDKMRTSLIKILRCTEIATPRNIKRWGFLTILHGKCWDFLINMKAGVPILATL